MSDVLLIHGACHGAWCWDEVASYLSGSGHRPIAVDLPSDDAQSGLAEYADAAIASLPSPLDDLIVVGHSLGALTAAIVAGRVKTRRLVFVAGIIGSPGMSLADLATVDAERDGHLGKEDLEFNETRLFRFTRAGAMRALFHDCESDAAELALARLRFQKSMWNEVADFPDWRADEIVSVVCAEDRVVNPSWGRQVSKERLGVDAVELVGGHSPWLSRPAELARILVE
jgi:pimeloyl-ACP methyl ester carboxylesterase